VIEMTDLGRNCLPPLDPTGPKELTPGEKCYLPAGDPDRSWRKQNRWLAAATNPETALAGTLAGSGALALLDDLFAVAEWGLMAPCPRAQAMAARLVGVALDIRDARTDDDRRSVSIGRELGVQPPGGKTAGFDLALKTRNTLLREARSASPEWAGLPPRRAGAKMIEAFQLYRAGSWQSHWDRETAPGGSRITACWWRLLRSGYPKPMPKIDRLSDILAE
jgi:hypothetical protein